MMGYGDRGPSSILSAYAMGRGMSGSMGGSGMMGSFGSGILNWFQKWINGSAHTNPLGEQGRQMEQLDRQHYEDSAYLRYQIQMKEKEMDALLKATNPDLEKVRALHRDIRQLRAEAEKEQRNYELKANKMNPGYPPGSSDDWSSYGSPSRRGSGGMGYGGRMGGGYVQGR